MGKEHLSSNARKRARKKAAHEARILQKNAKATKNAETSDQKNKKNKKAKHNHPITGSPNKKKPIRVTNEGEDDDEEGDLLAFAAAWAGGDTTSKTSTKETKKQHKKISHSKNITKPNQSQHHNYNRKPPAFPASLQVPKDDFVRDTHDPSLFQAALETSYEGLVWEGPSDDDEIELRSALTDLSDAGLFRTDVTQPAGLGAKLVLSYVTRCLLGDEGTTYRYLGLRMFSHPWNGKHHNDKGKKLTKALQSIEKLNKNLGTRTQNHLDALAEQRRQRESNNNDPYVQGRSTYNVTLINRMAPHKRLRDEPMFGTNKYSVGWHADSSLEHFSSIAVYHTLMTEETTNSGSENHQHKHKKKKQNFRKTNIDSDDWAVALRVAHDCEGPRAKRLGDITVEETAPPIAVSLPSGSTYFMLDDFNHHHQHAVLAPHNSNKNQSIVRYSSTHRLLRQGHNVQDILARCSKITMGNTDSDVGNDEKSGFWVRHGPKRWRSEQVLLNELETEWLRQFFIQGAEHKELLWGYWKEPLQQLFRYWESLERRTLQVLTLMRDASMERCGTNSTSEGREALKVMAQVQGDRKSAADTVYVSMANLLLERAKLRDLWSKRERDSVFQRLPEGCHPIPFPVGYGMNDQTNKARNFNAMACSPMPDGSSRYLAELASQVKIWGEVYENRRAESLPGKNLL